MLGSHSFGIVLTTFNDIFAAGRKLDIQVSLELPPIIPSFTTFRVQTLKYFTALS